jgi:hypothetical protein
MLAAARSRLLGRAAAFSASLMQPHASGREVSKMAAAAQARAAAREAAADPATEAKASASSGRPTFRCAPLCSTITASPSAVGWDARRYPCRLPAILSCHDCCALPLPCLPPTPLTRPTRRRPRLQARALDSVLKEINSRFGKNSIMQLGTNTYGEV